MSPGRGERPSRRSSPALAVSFVAALAALAGCRRPAPLEERPLAIGQITSAVTLDPHRHDEEATYSCLSHFYEKLVGFGPEMEIVPELAVRWENPSESVWRFHLRPGVTFHDGRPLEAADVVASVRRVLDLPDSPQRFYLQSVRDVRAAGPLLVDVITAGPSPVLLNKLVYVSIVPRGTGPAPVVRPIGTGPYVFVSGGPRQPVEGVRNERYWGPRPAYRRVRVVPFPNERERAEAVALGRADLVARVPEELRAAAARDGVRIVARPGLGVTFLGFSVAKGSPFADPRVRRAFALSVDRTALVKGEPEGAALAMDQLVPSVVFGYVPNGRKIGYDPGEARRLLAEAGHGDGLDATLSCADSIERFARRLAGMLATSGIRLTVDARPWTRFYEGIGRREYPLFLMTWTAGTGDASDLLEGIFHTAGGDLGASNYFAYSDPKLDRLVEQAGATFDPHARRRLMGAALDVVNEDLPAIPLVLRSAIYAVRSDLAWSPRADRRVRAQDVRPAGG